MRQSFIFTSSSRNFRSARRRCLRRARALRCWVRFSWALIDSASRGEHRPRRQEMVSGIICYSGTNLLDTFCLPDPELVCRQEAVFERHRGRVKLQDQTHPQKGLRLQNPPSRRNRLVSHTGLPTRAGTHPRILLRRQYSNILVTHPFEPDTVVVDVAESSDPAASWSVCSY